MIKYIKLILSGFKLLTLNNIHYFEINPREKAQLILGPNGSGKTSLLKEFSPLPPSEMSNEFLKGGYKEIHIQKDDDVYVLKSVYDGKVSHSITKNDGDNLNPGGTISVQRKLIEQIFNYTDEIHEIITSDLTFTSMKANQRRYWLTKLSNTSFEYAISTFNKLKDKQNDTSSTIRTLKKRLVQETEKIVDIDFQKKLETEIEQTHKALSMMLELRRPVDETKETLDVKRKDLYNEIATVSTNLINVLRFNPGIAATSVDSLDSFITEIKSDIKAKQLLSQDYCKKIEQIDESIAIVEKTKGSSIQDLTSKILRHQMKQSEIVNLYKFEFDDNVTASSLTDAISSVEEALGLLSVSLVPNPDRFLGRDRWQQLTIDIKLNTQRREALQKRLETLQATKTHQEVHRDTPAIECPKCAHKWHLGYNEDTYNKIVDTIENIAKDLEQNKIQKEELDSSMYTLEKYFNEFRCYMRLTRSWPILDPLWKKIDALDLLFNNPIGLTDIVNEFKQDALLKKEYDTLSKDIEDTKALIVLAEQVGGRDYDKLVQERQELESKLYSNGLEVTQLSTKLKSMEIYRKDRISVDNLKSTVEQLLEIKDKLYLDTQESIRRELFNECIRNIQSSLSRKELAISEIRGQRSIIGDIENQIDLLTKDEVALKLLVKELSPTEGLIAEGMYGFIRKFVKTMNVFIGKVWSYPMVIEACGLDPDSNSVELDYKFPAHINGEDLRPSDVSKCSKGQREIIDLSFVVLFMKQMGLGSNPILLDEFAANLDHGHRLAAINIVKSLIEQHTFSQLFMVNHYDGIYGAFTNAQFTVLSEDNIILPKDCVYNKHVNIR